MITRRERGSGAKQECESRCVDVPAAIFSLRQLFIAVLLTGFMLPGVNASAQATGFRDFSFANSDGFRAPTGSKPESKVWFNDGNWWAVLFNPDLHGSDIYRLDASSQTWTDTGTPVDDRPTAKSDTLWDQSSGKLYLVSNLHDNSAGPSSDPTVWGRLYRFSYDAGSRGYSLDSGFPVTVTKGTEETLTLAKDSSGMLWVAYVESGKVMVNHSNGSDNVWGAPFVLPVGATARATTSDDIAAVIAFGGNQIGVFWSNQNSDNDYFAIHQDGASATMWLPQEIAIGSGVNCTGACADDHINIKADSTGRIYVATKTSFTGKTQPLVNLLMRDVDGDWWRMTYSTYAFSNTRGIVVLDEPDDRLYFFVTSSEAGGKIDYKVTSMSNPSFTDGDGNIFLGLASDTHIANPTTSKQNATGSSGVLVMASDDTSNYYVHNFLDLGAAKPPTVSSFSPASGGAGTQVLVAGTGFDGSASVKFNGVSASSSVNSSTQITATLPANATSGPIGVTTTAGTATSADSFTVTGSTSPAPVVTGFSPAQGAIGAAIMISGSNFTGANGVTFNTTVTSKFTVNNDGSIIVTVPTGATTGPISVTTPLGGTGTSSGSFTVNASTRLKDMTFENASVLDPVNGFDAKTGTVNLETSSPIKGADSISVSSASSYGQENYTPSDEIFASLYLRFATIPAGQIRVVRIADRGTTVGVLTLEAGGKLSLRNFTTNLGSTATALKPGTLYRIGLHQKRGSGSNGILEGFVASSDNSFGAPFASSSTQTFTTQADSVQIGATTAVGGDVTVDDVRLDSGSMPGPSLP